MNRKLNKAIILILIIFISIGFAYLTTNLYINGNSLIKANSWSIYFDNISEYQVDGEINSHAIISSDKKEINFEVTLEKPGDEYYFYVDVVNDGTLDAMLDLYEVTGLTTDQDKYVDWIVTYADGASLSKYDLLTNNSKDTFKVAVKYIEDVNYSDLPTENDVTINLKFKANYVQAEDNVSNTRTVGQNKVYTIRYNLDGGAIENNPTTYTELDEVKLPNPIKEGYTFTGWTAGKNLFSGNFTNSSEWYNVEMVVDNSHIIIRNIDSSSPSTKAGDLNPKQLNYFIPAGTYTASVRNKSGSHNADFLWLKLYTLNNGYNSFIFVGNNSNYEKTVTYEAEITKFSLGVRINCTFDNLDFDFQVEEGSVCTDYEPHIETPTKDIVIPIGSNGNRTYVANWIAN